MIKFNLHQPLSKLEEKNGRYSYAAIAESCGLTRQGVRRLLKEDSQTLSVSTIGKLLDFFAAEGMPISVNDLFTYEDPAIDQ